MLRFETEERARAKPKSNEPNEPLETVYDASPGALVAASVSYIPALRQPHWGP